MLLQRKNDRRDASSTGVTLYGVPGAMPAGSRSGRKTNDGLARIRRSANSTPRLEAPPRAFLLVEREEVCRPRRPTPAGDTPGGASVETIRVAQAVSAACAAFVPGWHTNTRGLGARCRPSSR